MIGLFFGLYIDRNIAILVGITLGTVFAKGSFK
jgi:hypothetical protein